MALETTQAIRLARTLRELRESAWPGVELTQAQLAKALSADSRVASATLSSWESLTNPKTPTASRLTSYARFFATRRSVEGKEPRLLAEKDLTADELERFRELESELLDLLHADTQAHRGTFSFDEGPVTIICPEAPEEERGRLADPTNPNFNKLQRLADLDALLEIWGHVRAENPRLSVRYRRPAEVVADDLSGHVILLGGIAWNKVTRRFQTAMSQVPITQVECARAGDRRDLHGQRRRRRALVLPGVGRPRRTRNGSSSRTSGTSPGSPTRSRAVAHSPSATGSTVAACSAPSGA